MCRHFLKNCAVIYCFIAATPVFAGIEYVRSTPLHEVAATQNDQPQQKQSNSEYLLSPAETRVIARKLLDKYGDLDEILLSQHELNDDELYVARVMLIKDTQRLNAQKRKFRTDTTVFEIKDTIDKGLDIEAAAKNPELIRKKRLIEDSTNRALREPLVSVQSNIRTITIDPESDDTIHVNFAKDAPATITFFGENGVQFPILRVAPENNEIFKREIIPDAGNILMLAAQENYYTVQGYIFLKSVSQPIPITYSTNPDNPINTKLIVQMAVPSPMYEATMETVGIDITPFSNQSNPDAFAFANGKTPPNAKRLEISGDLPAGSKAWVLDGFHYIRTKARKRYSYVSAHRLGSWFVYKLYPRTRHYFEVGNKKIEVSLNEQS